VASYTVSLLNPKVIADLDLHGYGLKIINRRVNNLWPHENGDFLAFLQGEKLTEEIARFSKKMPPHCHGISAILAWWQT
jgi:hypothetical protein